MQPRHIRSYNYKGWNFSAQAGYGMRFYIRLIGAAQLGVEFLSQFQVEYTDADPGWSFSLRGQYIIHAIDLATDCSGEIHAVIAEAQHTILAIFTLIQQG